MPDFHKAFGKNMLQESPDGLHGIQCGQFPFFLPAVLVQKFDDPVIDASDTIVGDGNPEHIS